VPPDGLFSIGGSSYHMYQRPKSNWHFHPLFKHYLFSVRISVSCLLS